MTKHYDLVVIGTGTAAAGVASRCKAAGWQVAIIDHLPFGGTCALRGCDPKRVLVEVADVVDEGQRLRRAGATGEHSLRWHDMMRFKRSFTDSVPATTEQSFVKSGIDAYHGLARFCGSTSVDVNGEILDGRFVLIATGAVPMRLGIPGEGHLVTSTEFLELDELPERIALVGGGFIAAEFSHVAERAGASVVVLEAADRMLMPFDPDLVDWLMARSRDVGIEVRLNTKVEGVEKRGAALSVHTSSSGQQQTIETDLVVHAAGRVPDLEPLNLSAARVESEGGRLSLNEYLQSTSNPAVYAAGDAAMKGPPHTPVASHDASVAAANLLKGNHRKPNYAGAATVAFTIPPIASVGMSEKQARDHGLKFRVHHEKASDWHTARRAAETAYGFKVLIAEESSKILGAHLIGPRVDEVINIFALAIRHDLTVGDLKGTIFAYPTGASDISYMI